MEVQLEPKPELFISVDIETDGAVPGENSMLSLGAAAFSDVTGATPLATFSANMLTCYRAHPDPDTTEWWRNHLEAYNQATLHPFPPAVVMSNFKAFIEQPSWAEYKPVLVAWPPAFDLMFIRYYAYRYCERWNVHRITSLDIRSYAAGAFGCSMSEAPKRLSQMFPELMSDPDAHSTAHVALDDAIQQGTLFMKLRRRNLL